MPEIGTLGLMSGDGKRSAGHRPQATAPILNSTGAADFLRCSDSVRDGGSTDVPGVVARTEDHPQLTLAKCPVATLARTSGCRTARLTLVGVVRGWSTLLGGAISARAETDVGVFGHQKGRCRRLSFCRYNS